MHLVAESKLPAELVKKNCERKNLRKGFIVLLDLFFNEAVTWSFWEPSLSLCRIFLLKRIKWLECGVHTHQKGRLCSLLLCCCFFFFFFFFRNQKKLSTETGNHPHHPESNFSSRAFFFFSPLYFTFISFNKKYIYK